MSVVKFLLGIQMSNVYLSGGVRCIYAGISMTPSILKKLGHMRECVIQEWHHALGRGLKLVSLHPASNK